ncbi:DUF4920 domain-containing protein [Mucilaginibacter segetis]|uniref:DUF4920 domain-containing protein n=1 Tax=Mucilaginibacter segetis TaxID=2793071 RepID=A0A934PSR7_9SPHI|nr:DUF4920 domain-containing protein [Mucilaginibacter segetis]MBK0380134.1 DUF4920 domain-containing protein [Mucilaginibacter segetis]
MKKQTIWWLKLTALTAVIISMRKLQIVIFILCIIPTITCMAQKSTPLPHGMVFGLKPENVGPVESYKIEEFMGKKTRVTTAIEGKILRVTKSKGGWFEMEAGKEKIIDAHFKDYSITLPKDIEGRTVIIEGVAERKFLADDRQHFAGDTVTGKKAHNTNPNPKQRISFEVRGLMVDI